MQVITEGKEIQRAIWNLLRDKDDERAVAVAFVGADALSYLPEPKGLNLFCWPRAGGTNPYAIEQLVRSGVKVRFVPKLHSKIYWSRKGGTLIGSANLSANGLGENGLHESAILIPPGKFDMGEYVRTLSPLRDEEFGSELARLRKEYEELAHKAPNQLTSGKRITPRSYLGWYESPSSIRQQWRLAYWDEEEDHVPSDAEAKYKENTGQKPPRWYMTCERSTDLEGYKHTLCFTKRDNAIEGLEWFIPQTLIKTSDKRRTRYPFVWYGATREQNVPFRLDKPFANAFRTCIRDYGFSELLSLKKPSKKFLDNLYNEMT